jgi:MEKK4 N-terminal
LFDKPNLEYFSRQSILSACRNIQTIFHEARERALRAISFAKTLRKDLEIASSFSLMAPLNDFLQRLCQADHVRVVAPHSCSHLMFVPGKSHHKNNYKNNLLVKYQLQNYSPV